MAIHTHCLDTLLQGLKLHLKMRYFDEIAKDPDCEMKPVEYYLTLADEVLANTERGNL